MTSQPATGPVADGRRSARQRTFLKGRLYSGIDGLITTNCTIRNLSARGALIEVPPGVLLGAAGVLLNVSAGTTSYAKVVWRRGQLLGLNFPPQL